MEQTNWKRVFIILIVGFIAAGLVFAYSAQISSEIDSLIASVQALISAR